MKKEIAEKWVQALRSGGYKQTKEVLRNSDGFCCLGVLCDLYKKEPNSNVDWQHNKGKDYYSFFDDESCLPKPVLEWSGIKILTARYSYGSIGGNTLIYHNDSGATFLQIADIIEREVENL
jgi:hypothetical protein